MVCTSYKTIFAVLAAMACSLTTANNVGVCYDPFYSSKSDEASIKADFELIRKSVTSVRLFQTMVSDNCNIVKLAIQAGLTVTAGVRLDELFNLDREVTNTCETYNQHPKSVRYIMVGNETMGKGISTKLVIDTIIKIKSCTNNQAQVGTVQRNGDFLKDEAIHLVKACDVLGANIYAFYTFVDTKFTTPIQIVANQYQELANKFVGKPILLTETGHPTGGATISGNEASVLLAQKFVNEVIEWFSTVQSSNFLEMYIFQMFDMEMSKTDTGNSEWFFGMYDNNRVQKYTINFGGDSNRMDLLEASESLAPPLTIFNNGSRNAQTNNDGSGKMDDSHPDAVSTPSTIPAASGPSPTTPGASPTTTGATPTTPGASPADSGATPTTPGASPADSGATPTTPGATPIDTGLKLATPIDLSGTTSNQNCDGTSCPQTNGDNVSQLSATDDGSELSPDSDSAPSPNVLNDGMLTDKSPRANCPI